MNHMVLGGIIIRTCDFERIKAEMTFAYSVYFRQNCLVPIFFCVFALFLILPGILYIVRVCRHKKIPDAKTAILNGIGILLCLFCLFDNGVRLARGGAFLLAEKEADAVEIAGVIEDTQEIGMIGGCKYRIGQNHGNGEFVVIGGTKYHLMTYGELKPGDRVSAKVLPKSQFVLEIEKIG